MSENKKLVEELFEAGCHLGHKTNKIHPKARKYIYTIDHGTSIIDLTKTAVLIEQAKEFVTKLAKENKVLLVVATKRVSTSFVNDLCQKNNIPHVTVKWPAGLLTNFEMISKNVKKLKTMRQEKADGDWNKFVKHEQVKLQKELNKLEKFYGGISILDKLPDALFVVDIKKEKNSVKEAIEKKIPVVAVVDTNVDPDQIDYQIPGNDDAATSIEYFVKEIVGAYTKNSK
ncbi:30S ribosomal protein S2 [Patescibacteria group bacterium]|nr:30S ribosomal protein S2 [Patescibacteria group bacterium]